jgi:hypothetical protein
MPFTDVTLITRSSDGGDADGLTHITYGNGVADAILSRDYGAMCRCADKRELARARAP